MNSNRKCTSWYEPLIQHPVSALSEDGFSLWFCMSFFIEPIVALLFFVSHSALLSVFMALVPGPLLCHTVSGSGLTEQIVLFHTTSV